MSTRDKKIQDLVDIYQGTTPRFEFHISQDGTAVTLSENVYVYFSAKRGFRSDTYIWDASCEVVGDGTMGICTCVLSLTDTTSSHHGLFAELRVNDNILQTSDVVGQYKVNVLPSVGGN